MEDYCPVFTIHWNTVPHPQAVSLVHAALGPAHMQCSMKRPNSGKPICRNGEFQFHEQAPFLKCVLEAQPQGQLDIAWVICLCKVGQRAEGCIVHIGIWRTKLRRIDEIERFRTKLQLHPVVDRKSLEDREIDVLWNATSEAAEVRRGVIKSKRLIDRPDRLLIPHTILQCTTDCNRAGVECVRSCWIRNIGVEPCRLDSRRCSIKFPRGSRIDDIQCPSTEALLQ